MKRKMFFLAIVLIGIELFIFSASKLEAFGPSPSPAGFIASKGGWYYHNYTGTSEGWVNVNSCYLDTMGTIWTKF